MESVGSTTVSVTKSPADTVPNVKIIGPVGLAEVNEVITLQAVFQSSCGSAVNAQPSFQWSYYAGPDGFVYSIDPSMTNLDSLSFAPFTFSTNQNYTFMLSVSVGAGEPYFFEYTISTASDEILTLPIESNAVMFVGNAMIHRRLLILRILQHTFELPMELRRRFVESEVFSVLFRKCFGGFYPCIVSDFAGWGIFVLFQCLEFEHVVQSIECTK
ncbi:hypothetical protein BCR33DRAFT_739405 [Rhizoclosmatium globosum]|uniref:REJ domain-containing protein n=1 Tax=Rhizoclosmatium globosum TaxID=329046 RepID=A0A1Y2C6F4_9FUNG|nr:hypothetical protein BCR33DRAFT_739405 [Rhizoclosmatium globosum]|eukprot:ORY41865.1 hypothetical protein BCR33DRAFT_739405 [Rhizoclosmatium globosum]